MPVYPRLIMVIRGYVYCFLMLVHTEACSSQLAVSKHCGFRRSSWQMAAPRGHRAHYDSYALGLEPGQCELCAVRGEEATVCFDLLTTMALPTCPVAAVRQTTSTMGAFGANGTCLGQCWSLEPATRAWTSQNPEIFHVELRLMIITFTISHLEVRR